jgi:outer membrane immunogenic protein
LGGELLTHRLNLLFPALMAGLVALANTSALAADMAVKAPPTPTIPSWTGFYLGANLGLGIGNKKFYDLYGPVPDFALDANAGVQGWIGGLQAGYNYQINSLVFGIEGQFDWSGVRSNFSCFSFGNQTCSANAEWFATLTGRVGALFGPALLYVNGGAAWTRDTVTDVATTAGCVPSGGTIVCSAPGDLFSGSQIRPGWTVGGGIEYRLTPNWSVRAQYQYMNFGERPITLTDGGTGIFPEEVKQQIQLIEAGFNYSFVGPAVLAPASPLVFKAAPSQGYAETIRAFSTFDVGKESVDGLVGAIFALSNDLDTSGPRLWIAGGAGWYQFPVSTGGTIRGVYSTGDILAGYAFEGSNYEINLLAGASAENDMLSAYDVTDPVNGTAGGAKVRGDIWINPTPQTLFYGEGEYSTAFQTYYTSAKFGYDVFAKGFFLGPEVSAFGDARFDQWRVGAHVTQLKFGRVEVDVSAGYARDSVVGSGAYGHLELSTAF